MSTAMDPTGHQQSLADEASDFNDIYGDESAMPSLVNTSIAKENSNGISAETTGLAKESIGSEDEEYLKLLDEPIESESRPEPIKLESRPEPDSQKFSLVDSILQSLDDASNERTPGTAAQKPTTAHLVSPGENGCVSAAGIRSSFGGPSEEHTQSPMSKNSLPVTPSRHSGTEGSSRSTSLLTPTDDSAPVGHEPVSGSKPAASSRFGVGAQPPSGPKGLRPKKNQNQINKERFHDFLREENSYVAEGNWEKFPDGSRLFVGNLFGGKINKRAIFDLFAPYGRLAQISIKDAYGFVQYHHPKEAQLALAKLQDFKLMGRGIHLEISRLQGKSDKPSSELKVPQPPPAAKLIKGRSLPEPLHHAPAEPKRFRGRSRSPQAGDSRKTPGQYRNRSLSPHSHQRTGSALSRYNSSSSNNNNNNNNSSNNNNNNNNNNKNASKSHENNKRDFHGASNMADVVLVVDNISRSFMNRVKGTLQSSGLKVEIERLLGQSTKNETIRQYAVNGVHAVVDMDHNSEIRSLFTLHAFNRMPGSKEVKFDRYDGQPLHMVKMLIGQTVDRNKGQQSSPRSGHSRQNSGRHQKQHQHQHQHQQHQQQHQRQRSFSDRPAVTQAHAQPTSNQGQYQSSPANAFANVGAGPSSVQPAAPADLGAHAALQQILTQIAVQPQALATLAPILALATQAQQVQQQPDTQSLVNSIQALAPVLAAAISPQAAPLAPTAAPVSLPAPASYGYGQYSAPVGYPYQQNQQSQGYGAVHFGGTIPGAPSAGYASNTYQTQNQNQNRNQGHAPGLSSADQAVFQNALAQLSRRH